MGPYIHHVYFEQERQFCIIMKYYQYDVSEIIEFFDKNRKKQKNRFTQSKSAFFRQLLLFKESAKENVNQTILDYFGKALFHKGRIFLGA